MTTLQFALVGVVMFSAALVQTSTGFGFSLTAVPMMALFTDTRTASMVAAVLSMSTSGFQSIHGRRHIDWPLVKRLGGAAAVGLPFGLVVFEVASERHLKLFLGVSTLAMVLLLVRGLDLSSAGPSVDRAAGFTAGVLTTSLSTNGPPLVFVLQGRRLAPDRFRASITTIFVLTGLVGLVGRAAVGGFTRDVNVAIAISPVPVLAGMFIGFRLRRHLDEERFRALVMILLVAAAVSAIAAAV